MRKLFQFLTIAALLTWGVTFIYFYTSGRIEKLLDPAFRVYAIISGIGFLLLGVFNLLNQRRQIACTHDHFHEHDHDHQHHEEDGHHQEEHSHEHSHEHHHHHHHEETPSSILFSLLVLLLPLLVATAQSQDRFSNQYLSKWGKIERQMLQMRIAEKRQERQADSKIGAVDPNRNPYTSDSVGSTYPEQNAVTNADTPPDRSDSNQEDESWDAFTLEDLKQMVPQNAEGDFQLEVPQIFYTAGDFELMEVMEGIPIETSAQLMEETLNNPNGHRLKAFRLFIECCAADARPLSIPIDFGATPPPYTEMGWYNIYGTLHYVEEEGEIIPVLRVQKLVETVEPNDAIQF